MQWYVYVAIMNFTKRDVYIKQFEVQNKKKYENKMQCYKSIEFEGNKQTKEENIY